MSLEDGRTVAVKIVSKRELFRLTRLDQAAIDRNAGYLLTETLTLKRLVHVRARDCPGIANGRAWSAWLTDSPAGRGRLVLSLSRAS